jgi:hypothetical protein
LSQAAARQAHAEQGNASWDALVDALLGDVPALAPLSPEFLAESSSADRALNVVDE